MTACLECGNSGGRCGYNRSTEEMLCFCSSSHCSKDGNPAIARSHSWKVITIAVVLPVTLLLTLLVAFIKLKGKMSPKLTKLRGKSASLTENSSIKEFIKSYRSMLPMEYSYIELKKITDNFKEKLGEGGYGNVYKGQLPNGQLVAAKVLEKSKENGQDFINEVATIGRIYHLNIIRLLGFCCEGSHRVLIYEFMPKGSLGDLLSKEEIRYTLGPQLLEIAIGIARGIDYLHNGCEKRILHLDIKPQNVLLDDSFQPKISDFGLAKSYSRKESNISLTGARGTIGYIAPEVFMRNLGGVSHKSDVYSYGMLLLGMVMGTDKYEASSPKNSSKEYFPDCIYDQLNRWLHMELQDKVLEEDVSTLRKIVMVGLWCIQTNPVNRPPISRALDMLKGGVESIDMPPKPVFFSPPKQQSGSSHNQSVSYIETSTYTLKSTDSLTTHV